MKQIIVIGAGGHGKVVADVIQNSGGGGVRGFLDSECPFGELLGTPILGRDTDYEKFTECYFIIAIGDSATRERISNKMKNARWYTAIHSRATVSSMHVNIGVGTVVMANALINPDVIIGKHCIINSAAVIEHDNRIGDYVHVSVGARLAGHVSIGNRTWVGIGAIVKNNVAVCNDCMIGAGAVVVKDIVVPGTYVGVPARKII